MDSPFSGIDGWDSLFGRLFGIPFCESGCECRRSSSELFSAELKDFRGLLFILSMLHLSYVFTVLFICINGLSKSILSNV